MLPREKDEAAKACTEHVEPQAKSVPGTPESERVGILGDFVPL